ncbi:methyltransferase domain-containing protein [Haloechinothrix sp. YIM 98757]|uniref:Methyltransferase domain-containing protein n=1 Tax=Haloechinothrix aidingensis TaxID=2752311 RepID=A0A838AES7_9PSEU|nr:methyltransferase domain-containing protein [Haloechinothrix aidingensis]MBA0127655.1 methyltransferase domain-containing protein [Haloechinothrix aidingensis]
MTTERDRHQRWHRYWDKHARTYDREMRLMDRIFFAGSRQWACEQATGDTLEVAIGTGLNLESYPDDVTLTGVDLSAEMLEVARKRAEQLGRSVELRQANAHELPFADASFDTVVCTLGLCTIPEERTAIDEMRRVTRPGGRLVLLDHVEAASGPVRLIQRGLELVTVPLGGEHFLRRPFNTVRAAGFEIEHRERFKHGLVERLTARRPVDA